MSDIPTGTVTFLFTDIEGSTKLAQEFPNSLPIALRKHHSIIEEAIKSNNGFVFELIGDAFCAAFVNADDAVNAAYDAQIKLNSEKWNGAHIKVRIGIHTGNAEWNGRHYMGYITLARTNRTMSVAYGGQILISNEAFDFVKEKVHSAISFRDLGERRLKDLIQPMRIYQIVSSELPSDFPPLRTLDASPNNLPVQLTSFIGREEEMKQIKDLLKNTHLLTLIGSGGSGKTRLSLQVAADIIDDFTNGVWFVELAPLLDPILLPQAITQALGVREEPKQSLEDTLCDYLSNKEMLIILDNCEHLIDASAKLTEKFLNNSLKLKIIATSREALRCEGEQTYRVPSLTIPDPKKETSLEKLTQYEGVKLFIERAKTINSNFRVNNNNAPALAQICYQLDGIPLGIELAAARIKVLSVEKIYERLDDRFKLLTGGKRTALPRQQTLKATIDWSYDLLTEKEKALWRRLSVFAGGWTLEAAEIICSNKKIKNEEVLELLEHLAEKSIIIFGEEKERYRMLETIRQYGEEKLKETEEWETLSTNHLKFYMELSESAEPKLKEAEMQTWLEILDAENRNLEKALLWSLEGRTREEGVRLAGALGYFWKVRGHFSVGRRWLESILGNSPAVVNSSRGKALNFAGAFARLQGEYEKARKLIEESLAIWRGIGDKHGIAYALNSLGNAEFNQGEFERAREFYDESLGIYREIGNKYGIAGCLNNFGKVALNQGEYEKARKFIEESLAIWREIGDKNGIALSLLNLGIMETKEGKFELAWKLIDESLGIKREIGDKDGISSSLNSLGNVASNQGNFKRAREFYAESLVINREIGNKYGIAVCLNNLGKVALDQGEYEKARKFIEESLAIRREIGDKYGIGMSLLNLGLMEAKEGKFELTCKLIEESLVIQREIGDNDGIAISLNSLGNVASNQGNFKRAREFYNQSLDLSREIGYKDIIAINLTGLGTMAFNQGEFEQARDFFEESLILNRKIGKRENIVLNILGFAGIQGIRGYHTQTARLMGIIEEVFQSMKAVLNEHDFILYSKIVSKLKEKLGDEEILKYKEEGKLMSLEQAIDLALNNPAQRINVQ